MKNEEFKVTVICGSEAVQSADWYWDEDIEKRDEWFAGHEDDCVTRCFETKAEMDAYLQGIDDATGWMETIVLTGDEMID